MKWFRLPGALLLAVCMLLSAGYAAAEKTILLTFTGDVTLGGKDEGRGLPASFESFAKAEGYDYFLADFREMFEQDDLTVINLEGVLTDSPYNEVKKTHAFRGATELVKVLTGSGIDAASLSNNHSGDYGAQGLKSTRSTLDTNGIAWFQDLNYYLFTKDGIRIAFVALQNSVLYTKQTQLMSAIRNAREADGAAAVVVCWHTGTEYKGYHNEDTEKRVKNLLSNGVDLVIINHPHVAQGMGVYNNRSVFYSLGNFVFGGNPKIRGGKKSRDALAISLYGMVVQARLTFSNEGKYLGQQMTAWPVFSSSENPDYQPGDKNYPVNNYRPMRLTVEQAQPVYECIRRDSAGEIPAMTEEGGFAKIVFPYIPAFDGVMLPEATETEGGTAGSPEVANPRPTRDDKSRSGN